jgi:hypothetical protein
MGKQTHSSGSCAGQRRRLQCPGPICGCCTISTGSSGVVLGMARRWHGSTTVLRTWPRWHQLGRWARPVQVDAAWPASRERGAAALGDRRSRRTATARTAMAARRSSLKASVMPPRPTLSANRLTRITKALTVAYRCPCLLGCINGRPRMSFTEARRPAATRISRAVPVATYPNISHRVASGPNSTTISTSLSHDGHSISGRH